MFICNINTGAYVKKKIKKHNGKTPYFPDSLIKIKCHERKQEGEKKKRNNM